VEAEDPTQPAVDGRVSARRIALTASDAGISRSAVPLFRHRRRNPAGGAGCAALRRFSRLVALLSPPLWLTSAFWLSRMHVLISARGAFPGERGGLQTGLLWTEA
jgi:hypothetical protein